MGRNAPFLGEIFLSFFSEQNIPPLLARFFSSKIWHQFLWDFFLVNFGTIRLKRVNSEWAGCSTRALSSNRWSQTIHPLIVQKACIYLTRSVITILTVCSKTHRGTNYAYIYIGPSVIHLVGYRLDQFPSILSISCPRGFFPFHQIS